MRFLTLAVVVLVAACAEPSVEMTLNEPNDGSGSAAFDMSCVTAIDLLALPNGDDTLDIGQRTVDLGSGSGSGTYTDVWCIDSGAEAVNDLLTPPTLFADLKTVLAGKFDIAMPKAGLAGVEIRGRAGTCVVGPPYHTSVFYGGATYKTGDSQLQIKISKGISCLTNSIFSVHPVDMLNLFMTKTCAPWTDTTAHVQANEIRATNLVTPATIVVEKGLDTVPMATQTVQVDSFSASFRGTCAAMELDSPSTSSTGLSCINVMQSTACAGTNLEVAVLADTFTASASPALVKQFGAANFVGIWTSTAPAGPIAGAKITVDSQEDDSGKEVIPPNKIVYGDIDISGTTFNPSDGATSTTSGGLAIVYVGSVVKITVKVNLKSSVEMYIGASPEQPSAQIAVVN